jgi:hypothetical protein
VGSAPRASHGSRSGGASTTVRRRRGASSLTSNPGRVVGRNGQPIPRTKRPEDVARLIEQHGVVVLDLSHELAGAIAQARALDPTGKSLAASDYQQQSALAQCGSCGGGGLPAIVGAAGQIALRINGGAVVRLEGLRIEASGGGNAIWCEGAASLAALRCEVAGGAAFFQGAGTTGQLTDCAIDGSEGNGLLVRWGATVAMEGGAIRGCARSGVFVNDSGSRTTVRLPPSRPLLFVPPALCSFSGSSFCNGPLCGISVDSLDHFCAVFLPAPASSFKQ